MASHMVGECLKKYKILCQKIWYAILTTRCLWKVSVVKKALKWQKMGGGDSSSMAYPNEYLFSSATISSFLKKKPSSCAFFMRGKSIIEKKSNLLNLSKMLLGGSEKFRVMLTKIKQE